jgi:prepilin-type N-terminal cleavage/methylation domain-containing protein
MFRPRARKGFTLIELLVVVAIIALLISILLPSLRDAREQAKIAKCLSNCRNLMQSTVQYFLDWNDSFPYYIIDQNGNINESGICTWSYGGKSNDNYWLTDAGGTFYIPVQWRPMNPYLMGTELEPDLKDGDVVLKRTEVPVLQCPSDKLSNQRRFHNANAEQVQISGYDDVGTSYHYNLHALDPKPYHVNFQGSTDPWQVPGKWRDIGQALAKNVMAKYSGSFVMYFEDPMDWGINGTIQTQQMGSHGKFSKHCSGFLDGHAEHKFMDTRTRGGPGWAAINPDWIRRIGEPPPGNIFYNSFQVNMDPVDE